MFSGAIAHPAPTPDKGRGSRGPRGPAPAPPAPVTGSHAGSHGDSDHSPLESPPAPQARGLSRCLQPGSSQRSSRWPLGSLPGGLQGASGPNRALCPALLPTWGWCSTPPSCPSSASHLRLGAPSSGLVSAGMRPGSGFLLTSCMLPFGGIPTGWAAGPEGQWGAGRAILHPEWSPPSVCVAWGKMPTSVGLPHP